MVSFPQDSSSGYLILGLVTEVLVCGFLLSGFRWLKREKKYDLDPKKGYACNFELGKLFLYLFFDF